MLTLTGVSKRFGSTLALDNISVDIRPGEVHALVGENGAGKSTLGKLMVGVHQPSDGELTLRGEPVALANPSVALGHGLVGIAQELSLMPTRSVTDNIMLAREITSAGFVNEKANRSAAQAVMDAHDMQLDPDQLVSTLPVAQQQKVEILRALSRDAQLILFDEPTARLPSEEALRLRDTVRGLADAGKAVVYVSHFLEEVLAISDTITILRNGKHIRTGPASAETRDTLIEGMTGSTLDAQFPKVHRPSADAPVVLDVKGLMVQGGADPITLQIKAGEIVGLSGLVGAGRSEIAMAIMGADPAEGRIMLDGKDMSQTTLADRINAGIALIPESRRDQGLMMDRPILDNTSLPYLSRVSGWFGLKLQAEREQTTQHCAQATVKYAALQDSMHTLSGGNQQKVLFARASLGAPKLLIVDEPTRGVDVGAKRKIYDLIADMAARGTAILLISSEIEEIIGLCHRALVVSQGHIVSEFADADITQEALMTSAFSRV
ncbi:sugar ABC transporter ATP-binding protein [Ascidiaceihabitans sp.]|uniref:sugar ABC transporter ATP-binding protein n=1 Tax=Ascidiaceihabitans sp. TaxID=1872644 RepID=UPI0032994552